MAPPAEVTAYANEVAGRLGEVLGPAFAGLYLHGSGATGGWERTRSDVDILVSVSSGLSREQKVAVAAVLQEVECPGAGLECSVVRVPVDEPVKPAPPFELHVATGATAKVVDGAGHPGDSDLVMHYAVCRERGLVIGGPPPGEVFPPVARQLLLEVFLGELLWGLENAPAHYAVLNACRAWAYADDAGLLSKVEGADWALDRGIDDDLVGAALRTQRGESPVIDREAVERLVTRAREALLGAALAEA